MTTDGLRSLMAGTWAAQAVYVAARLGVADHLAQGPRTTRELAELCGANDGALYRVLRALSALGVFWEEGGGFSLAPAGRLLVRDAPGSLRSLAIWNGEVSHRMWAHALDVVRDGTPAPRRLMGTQQWDYLSKSPDLQATFDDAMAGIARQTAAEVLGAFDFSRVSQVVDVGGGNGTLLAAILRAHPHIGAVLVDRPEVVSGAHANLEPFSDRCQVVGGDFKADVPPGADVYILSSVLHDWDDDAAVQILATCRRAMTRTARLLVIECVLGSDRSSVLPLLLDLHMLVMTGGRERTEPEYRELLSAAALEMEDIIPLPGAEAIITGKQAGGERQ